MQREGETAPATSALRFAIGDEAGAAKLRAGTYVITLDDAAGALGDYGLARVDGAPLGLYRGDAPAGHARLLMTIA